MPTTAVEMLPAPQEEHEIMRLGDELIAVAMDDLSTALETALAVAKGELGRCDTRIRELKQQIKDKAAALPIGTMLAGVQAASSALNAIGGSVTASVTLGEADIDKRSVSVTAKLVQNGRDDNGGRSYGNDSIMLTLSPIRFDDALMALATELEATVDQSGKVRKHVSKIEDEMRTLPQHEKKMRADLGRLRLEQTVGGKALLESFTARTREVAATRLSNAGLDVKQLNFKS